LAHGIPARLSAAEGRKFALTVGGAFLALAGVATWRGHVRVAAVLGSLGVLLVLAGLVAPAHLGPVQRAWMGLALLLSKVTTPGFMGLVYFVVLTPIALLRRAHGHDSLVHRETDQGFWVGRTPGRTSSLSRQF
jgi:hypothetical protein